ncbi:hypothetical protein C1637_09490 [Chryseobacterium lactis]|uniref:Uncharacterized protein n=1 Tax=Chryseobacterium lactis TaxID=1241981 RepID=A0A3G6RHZ4_CHRLC|nr:hypothetical protein [Chryseobacterium lactis]AZA82255.1 hypothetical protein EG342_10215 [Chryseobacterium lactis]AZB02637.1 hypothetical protein EG341_01075 [Chryseobacterium lactis]PNW14070.1 hypothetical protein C1637_09490 [Chryseobacterium lactis]
MKTFDEDFNYFRQNYTFERMFLRETFSSKRKDWLLLIPMICVFAGCVFICFNFWIWGLILAISSFLVFFYYVILVKTKQAKIELEKNNLPFSKSFYKWKLPDHDGMRIRKVAEFYTDTNNDIIVKRINMAKEKVKADRNEIFMDIQSIVSFFGKNFITLFLGFFIGQYSKSNYSTENFEALMSIIKVLFFFGLMIALMWVFFVKKNYTDLNENNNKQYHDYIFVMENVLLMRM